MRLRLKTILPDGCVRACVCIQHAPLPPSFVPDFCSSFQFIKFIKFGRRMCCYSPVRYAAQSLCYHSRRKTETAQLIRQQPFPHSEIVFVGFEMFLHFGCQRFKYIYFLFWFLEKWAGCIATHIATHIRPICCPQHQEHSVLEKKLRTSIGHFDSFL